MITTDERQDIPPEALLNSDRTGAVPSTLSADVVIIGSGMGGGTLAWALRDSGIAVLVVERGRFLPREPENAQPAHMFIRKRYATAEPWFNGATGQPFQPGV